MTKKKQFSLSKIIIYVLLFAFGFAWMYPFLWMLSASLKTQSEFFASSLNLFPAEITMDNFIRAWESANFAVYFKNSIIVTVSVVCIVLFATSLTGYVMGRYNFFAKKVVLTVFVASITIPLVFTIIPIFELLKTLGLSSSLFGLILAESGGGHVIFIMLFMSFYAQMPKEMEEAAMIMAFIGQHSGLKESRYSCKHMQLKNSLLQLCFVSEVFDV